MAGRRRCPEPNGCCRSYTPCPHGGCVGGTDCDQLQTGWRMHAIWQRQSRFDKDSPTLSCNYECIIALNSLQRPLPNWDAAVIICAPTPPSPTSRQCAPIDDPADNGPKMLARWWELLPLKHIGVPGPGSTPEWFDMGAPDVAERLDVWPWWQIYCQVPKTKPFSYGNSVTNGGFNHTSGTVTAEIRVGDPPPWNTGIVDILSMCSYSDGRQIPTSCAPFGA